MARIDPLTKFRGQAQRLRHLFSDRSLLWFDSALIGKKDTSGSSFTPEALYELLCYFSLIRFLQGRVHGLRLIRPQGTTGYRFPYAPGDKERFAFFRFEFRGRTFDLCLGTSLPDVNDPAGEPEETPDISLQRIDVSVTDVDAPVGRPVRIWDAKYHAKARFAKHDYQQLNTWCDILGLPVPLTDEATIIGLLDQCFELSAVITNARTSPFNSRVPKSKRFRVVFEFDGDAALAVVKP
jgi:hypothetical protein